MQVELIAITPNAEKVIEEAGRTCYLSFDSAGADSEKRFIRMLLKNGHLSVLEHAYATFRVRGGSRAMTHQLVRHRLCAFSQQSQRYVEEKAFSYVQPKSIMEKPEAQKLFVDTIKASREAYSKLVEMGVKKEDARFLLPNAVESEIVVSANFREWRHVIGMRGEKGAQWEIREFAVQVLKSLRSEAPTAFSDFEIDAENNVIKKVELAARK